MTEASPRSVRRAPGNLNHMALGRRGFPKPPPHIWDEMAAAGAAGDDLRLGLAHAAYEQWLVEQGYRPDHATGNHIPEKAWD